MSVSKAQVIEKVGLNESEAEQFIAAMGDEKVWPKMTTNPKVNYAVDMYIAQRKIIFKWDNLRAEHRRDYAEEVQEAKDAELLV